MRPVTCKPPAKKIWTFRHLMKAKGLQSAVIVCGGLYQKIVLFLLFMVAKPLFYVLWKIF